MKRNAGLVAIGVIVLFGSGCSSRDDITARYEMERRLWQAQLYERRINISFLRASQNDLQEAIGAFSEVVAYDPLSRPGAREWPDSVRADIRRIRMASTVALGNLYFLSEEYYEAGAVYRRSLGLPLGFRASLEARLGLARSMFLAGEEDSLATYSADLFDAIRTSNAFWRGQVELDEAYVNIPLVLVRIYRDRHDRASFDRASADAEKFFNRVVDTWPGSTMANVAASSLITLQMIREDWPAAVAAIDRVTADPSREDRPGLLLLRAEILAFQMGRTSEGRRIFDDVAAGDSYAAPAARLDVAILQLQSGDKDEGMALLRALETDRATPADIASRAMLVRARQFENDDTWDEALPILRRILRLYPFTSAAIEAPLVATRHYIEAGDREMARRSLERAREYYLSLMDRSSKFGGDRFAVADMLVENYLVAGEAQEAAELLQTSSSRWDDASTAGGMYRSALIYSDVLDDPVSARHILEKCIELFPDTRYAKIAQRQLRALEAKN